MRKCAASVTALKFRQRDWASIRIATLRRWAVANRLKKRLGRLTEEVGTQEEI